MSEPSPFRRRGARRTGPLKWVGGALLAVLLVGGGWWAGITTMVSPIDDAATSATVTPTWGIAQAASVGRTLPVSVTVEQPSILAGENHLSGVVTRVNPGTRDQGEVVYTVGTTSVRVIAGADPFWRDLSVGTKGSDVTDLQLALKDLNHLTGEADGVYGPATRAAVIRWQKELGLAPTGSVPLGEVITVERLPAQLTLGEPIAPGRSLSGAEEAVFATVGEHEFTMVLGQEQAQLIPIEATVLVAYQDHEWEAVITSSEEDANQHTVMTLHAPDGGPVCGEECSALPTDERLSILAKVVIVAPTTGIGVPTAAVSSDAHGQAFVTTRHGQTAVEVLGAGQGMTIVTGIEVGTEVRLNGVGEDDAGGDSGVDAELDLQEEQ